MTTPLPGRSRINALRAAVDRDPTLSSWPQLLEALAACETDEQAEQAMLGAQFFTNLRPRSLSTLGMVLEARRRGLAYELTVTDDPAATRALDRYEIQMAMLYPVRRNSAGRS